MTCWDVGCKGGLQMTLGSVIVGGKTSLFPGLDLDVGMHQRTMVRFVRQHTMKTVFFPIQMPSILGKDID